MKALRSLLTLTAIVWLAACDSGSSSGAPLAEPGVSARTAEVEARPSVLESIRSPRSVVHGGTRVFEAFDALGLSLAYREAILVDGEGNFSLHPIEPLTPVGGAWLQEQELLEGFLFRYRDFAIRDRQLFLRNYRLEDLGQDEVVAGRLCSVYAVERRVGATRRVVVFVDDENGLVLKYEEFDRNRQLTARMAYERFDAEPELDTAVWFQSLTDEVSLDLEHDLGRQVGSAFPAPRLLPDGYQLAEASKLDDGTHGWIKLTYCDGVESLFYLSREATGAEVERGPAIRSAGSRSPEAGDLYVYRIGAAAAAQAVVDGYVFFVVGKVDDQALVDLIESALP